MSCPTGAAVRRQQRIVWFTWLSSHRWASFAVSGFLGFASTITRPMPPSGSSAWGIADGLNGTLSVSTTVFFTLLTLSSPRRARCALRAPLVVHRSVERDVRSVTVTWRATASFRPQCCRRTPPNSAMSQCAHFAPLIEPSFLSNSSAVGRRPRSAARAPPCH
jgi:hypothetical protein